MRRAHPIALVLALFATAAGCGTRDAGSDHFVWQGSVPAGNWVRIRNLNGPIHVEPTTGSEVRVTAVKRYRGFRPQQVRFVAQQQGDDAVVCAVWGNNGRCGDSDYRSGTTKWWNVLQGRGSVSVEFVVALPPGVRVDASTTNGSVRVAGAAAPVTANTVNGAIHVATTAGPINATTVNGSIVARADSLVGDEPMRLTSVNGSVTAELPDQLDATLDLETVNGHLDADYPITVRGAVDRKHVRGTVGGGGRAITLETVNGRVVVRRAGAGR